MDKKRVLLILAAAVTTAVVTSSPGLANKSFNKLASTPVTSHAATFSQHQYGA